MIFVCILRRKVVVWMLTGHAYMCAFADALIGVYIHVV